MKAFFHTHATAIGGFLTALVGWAIANQSSIVTPHNALAVSLVTTVVGAGAAMLGASPLTPQATVKQENARP